MKPKSETALVTTQGQGELVACATFEQLVEAWLNSDAMLRVRDQSKATYRKSLQAFKVWLDSNGVTNAGKEDVKAWSKAMENSEGVSVATHNLRLTTLRNFFKWLAAEHGLSNIVENIKGLKETKEHRRGFLTCPEMKRLLDVVPTDTLQGKRDKAILGVLLAAGLRTIEINRLRVGDIIHNGGLCYLAVLGKGRDERETVKVSRKAEQLIQEWLKAREQVETLSDTSPLFCGIGNRSFGQSLSSTSVSKLCKKYLELAGLKTKEIVAHSLRHSLATNALMKGAKLDEVQQQLRHVNLTTTQIYLHEVEKAKNPCTDLISEEIF